MVAGFISLFLLQVEPLLWRRGIFKVFEDYEGQLPLELNPLSGFWLFPFEWVPAAHRGGLWIPAAIVYLANAVLLDRFIAKHGGDDVSFRFWILRLRRLLAGIPLLGLCAIRLWRILCNRRPGWALRRTASRPVLEGELAELGPLREGAYLHSFPFILWIVVSNPFALRAALAWLTSRSERPPRDCWSFRESAEVCALAA